MLLPYRCSKSPCPKLLKQPDFFAMTPSTANSPTLYQWVQRLQKGELSAEELLLQVEQDRQQNDREVQAYLSADLEHARRQISRQGDKLSSSKLAGVPIAIKDNICSEGDICSCGSRYLQNFRAPYSATAITRLQQAGGIAYGRLNMDEFAMGGSCQNSALQVTRNPHNLLHVPGGSSGGSAAAVAAGSALASLGSDTGGSVRQPASYCGVVGLKPTYGAISRYGLVSFASSLDQIGTLTRDVSDAALLLDILVGKDPLDSTSVHVPQSSYMSALGNSVKGLRIGLPKEYFATGLDPRVAEVVKQAAAKLAAAGAELVEISLPHSEAAVATYYIIAPAEASSNLSRYDGVRYGERASSYNSVQDLYAQSREQGFGQEVKRRILLGTYVLSSGYYDAYYNTALKVRSLVRQDFKQAFEKVDVILSPVSPCLAPLIADAKADPLQSYLEDCYTVAANLAGLPAMSVPAGMVDGLPVGVQLIGSWLDEARMLGCAWQLEQSLK